jgi:hypothetical protein
MRRSAEEWADDLEGKPLVTGFKILGILLGTGIVIVMILWGFGVITAPWKGQGDAYQQKNSAQNWVAAQKTFHTEFNDVEAYKAKIAQSQKDITAYEIAHPQANGTPFDPAAQQDANLHTVLTGLQQQCQNTVADYNTNAESYLTESWRDAQLPDHLDPATCQ